MKALAALILIVSALIIWAIIIGGAIFFAVQTGHAAGSFTVKNWIAAGVLTPILVAISSPFLRWAAPIRSSCSSAQFGLSGRTAAPA